MPLLSSISLRALGVTYHPELRWVYEDFGQFFFRLLFLDFLKKKIWIKDYFDFEHFHLTLILKIDTLNFRLFFWDFEIQTLDKNIFVLNNNRVQLKNYSSLTAAIIRTRNVSNVIRSNLYSSIALRILLFLRTCFSDCILTVPLIICLL